MTLTEQFKSETERILKEWQHLVGYHFTSGIWSENLKRVKGGKDKILNDAFFLSLKDKTGEEQKHFFKRLEYFYNVDPAPDGVKSMSGAAETIRTWVSDDPINGSRENGFYAITFYDLKNNFLKMIDPDKWENTEKLTALEQAKTKAEQERDAVKATITQYKEKLGDKDPEQLKKDKEALEEAKNTAETERNNANIAKAAAETAKATAEAERDQANREKATAEQASKDKDAEIKKLKEEAILHGNQDTEKLNTISRKLMGIYNEQISKETELFYQDLSLDNNEINEKYGDKDKPYLRLLGNTNENTEPEEVINAFRVVALIKAVEKAQETHDINKNNLATLPKQLKKMNLNKFKKINDTWELLEGEPKEENNPLYLPIIKDKNQYITKINEIINLWQ